MRGRVVLCGNEALTQSFDGECYELAGRPVEEAVIVDRVVVETRCHEAGVAAIDGPTKLKTRLIQTKSALIPVPSETYT